MTFFHLILGLVAWALCALLVAGCTSQPINSAVEKTTFRIPGTIAREPQHPADDWVPGISNFAVISSDVWRGAKPTADGLRLLASAGVKTIIDLREDDESADVPPGLQYVRLPVSAWKADKLDVDRVLQTIDESPKPVFIHCREGRDRTGLAVAAYRLRQGMSEQDVCQELRNFRVNPWWRGPIEERIHELTRQTTARPLQPLAVSSLTGE